MYFYSGSKFSKPRYVILTLEEAVKIKITCYLRQLRDGKQWYASWRASSKDSLVYRRVSKPTGVPERLREKDRGKEEAKQVGLSLREEWLKDEAKPVAPRVPTYGEWISDFYTPNSRYLNCRADHGKPVSAQWAHTIDLMIRKHVLPKWKNLHLDQFNVLTVEDWLADLPLSPKSRRALSYAALRIPLKEAVRGGIIKTNPLSELQAPAGSSRRRDIFTLEELAKLFPRDEKRLAEIWGSLRKGAMFALLAYSGVRTGEVRALRWGDVQGSYLKLCRAVKRGGEIGPLKMRGTGEGRVAILLPHMAALLSLLRGKEPDSALIFPSEVFPSKSYTAGYFSNTLTRVLKKEGISKKGRFLDCHSMRHSFNTIIRPILPQALVMQMMGHRSVAVNDVYNHPSAESQMKQLEGFTDAIDAAFKG